ncbi:unnamed protein product [Prunus brigantina]
MARTKNARESSTPVNGSSEMLMTDPNANKSNPGGDAFKKRLTFALRRFIFLSLRLTHTLRLLSDPSLRLSSMNTSWDTWTTQVVPLLAIPLQMKISRRSALTCFLLDVSRLTLWMWKELKSMRLTRL